MEKESPQSALFDVSIARGVANVKREFVFKSAKINIDIAVPIKEEMDTVSVADLHRRSVRMAIGLLEGLVPPEK